jgi:hypothetical protein
MMSNEGPTETGLAGETIRRRRESIALPGASVAWLFAAMARLVPAGRKARIPTGNIRNHVDFEKYYKPGAAFPPTSLKDATALA